MEANSAYFQARTYVNITGVPPEIDLFTAIPRKSHMHGEDGIVNVQTIAQILIGCRLQVENDVIPSPIVAVGRAERGRWRCRAYMDQVENFMDFMPPIKEYVLPNPLDLDTSQTIGADNTNVRAEITRLSEEGTPHPPPSATVRFEPLPARWVQRRRGTKGRS